MRYLIFAAVLIASVTTAYAEQSGMTTDSERDQAARQQSQCNPCYNQTQQ